MLLNYSSKIPNGLFVDPNTQYMRIKGKFSVKSLQTTGPE